MFQDLKHQKGIATIKPDTKPSKPKYIRKPLLNRFCN